MNAALTRLRRLTSRLLPLAVGGLVSGCALLKPLPAPSTVDDRLKAMPTQGLPLKQPVTIHWDAHQIPYIVAETDDDAAFGLGLVHTHLRLGQMAVYRRIAQGRIAEMGGPLATEIDHGIRILDFGRAVPAMRAMMPQTTEQWLQRYVDGINHYQASAAQLPYEYAALGLKPEPWSVDDVLRFGRLAGTDVTWLVWFNLLQLRQRADWPQIWARLTEQGAMPAPGGEPGSAALGELLAGISRSGSNSLALAPSRTTTGGAILANDPHLGINLPNTWLIVGLKSPSYHVVGLMIPGLPFFAIGRNPAIAWGGTNLRAAASDLIDVSGLPASAIRERSETINVRLWPDRQVTIRETPYGPVISDAPQLARPDLAPLALRWVGHDGSDEVTAMLMAAKAESFAEFREALAGFAVSGQTMVYADRDGNIGSVIAARVPDRSGPPPKDMVLTPAEAEASWSQVLSAATLPATFNPASGYIASANNRPADAGVGFFFSPEDRVRRMAEVVEEQGRLDVAALKTLQRDVYVSSSVALRDAIVGRIRGFGIDRELTGDERRVFERMAVWDGYYRAESEGAVAFELVRSAFVSDFYAAALGSSDAAAFAGVGQIKTLLLADIEAADPKALAAQLRAALAAAAASIGDFPTWGEMHRLQLGHPLRFVPLLGRRFRFADHPIGGTTESLMKTAHGTTAERHAARYGANARHVSDLSDPNGNFFVILGGQDGWLNSSTFLDQVPLWLDGSYVQMPLDLADVARRFPIHMTLEPAA